MPEEEQVDQLFILLCKCCFFPGVSNLLECAVIIVLSEKNETVNGGTRDLLYMVHYLAADKTAEWRGGHCTATVSGVGFLACAHPRGSGWPSMHRRPHVSRVHVLFRAQSICPFYQSTILIYLLCVNRLFFYIKFRLLAFILNEAR